MIREKSCGAVIYAESEAGRLYLVEKMQRGHCSLCKGHVEPGETEHDTAAREIREETGLTVTFCRGFRECIEYSPYTGCLKQVVFFAAHAAHREVTAKEEEVAEIYWLPLPEALARLTHASDRDVLRKADAFLDRQEDRACLPE